jgi:hypothetical protein
VIHPVSQSDLLEERPGTSAITPPINPVSWKSGSQNTPRTSESAPQAACIRAEFSIKLPWVTMTPLGAAVEPEVYWRNASVSRP